MPLTISGQGYRTFSEPSIFEAEDDTQIAEVEYPTDKSFAFVAADDGSANFELWKFDSASVAVAGPTVIVPNNPFYAASGRWIEIPTGGGGGTGLAIIGSGPPEGVQTAAAGAFYWDNDALPTGQALYLKVTGIGNTGWIQLLQFA